MTATSGYPGLRNRLLAVLLSTVVCCFAGGPSFVIAWNISRPTDERWWIVVGSLVFIVAYGCLVWSEWFWRHWRQPRFRRTVATVAAFRVGITVVFPVGVFLDCLCAFPTGALMMGISSDEDIRGILFLIWTLLHGIVLSLVLFGLVRIVDASLSRTVPLIVEPICPHCRYDLRASTGRCPECGKPIPAEVARLTQQTAA